MEHSGPDPVPGSLLSVRWRERPATERIPEESQCPFTHEGGQIRARSWVRMIRSLPTLIPGLPISWIFHGRWNTSP